MYKPTFCCDCGEKIERLNWNIFTNRRFCEFCETEHNLDTLIRKSAIVFLSLFAAYGIASYFVSENNAVERSFSSERINFEKANETEQTDSAKPQAKSVESVINGQNDQVERNGEVSENEPTPNNKPLQAKPKNLPVQKEPPEPVYFCGAATKKGTPCSRRVKGGGRCWQHVGKDAILPEKDLRIDH